MKKLLFFAVLILALAFLGFSAGISVSLPSGGPNYYKGTTHNITWTKGGSCTGSSIKINIFKNSVDPANFVEQLTAGISATSKQWTIGMGYVTGTYIIRVKTDDNSCFGDSPTFSITDAPGGPATITVNNPNTSTNNWYIGNTKNITWSTTGISNGTALKINIFRNSIDPANFVEQLNATNGTNSGSKSWTISSTQYTAGTYKIRIKTANDSVFGNSDSFTLKTEISLFVPGVILVRDFELKDVSYVFSRGGWIVARIKNLVNRFDGDLKFRVNFPDDPLPLGTTFNYTKHLVMGVNSEQNVYLTPASEIPGGDIPFCGKRVIVTLDPDNDFGETNERNNREVKRIYTKSPDLQVTAPHSELEVKKAYLKSSHRWRIIFKIHAYGRGTGYSSINNVRVRWLLKRQGADDSQQLYSHSFDTFTINHNGEKIFSVNKTFGHPDKKRSVRPRLSEGNYSIVVFISSSERLCERNRSNNRYQFTVNLH